MQLEVGTVFAGEFQIVRKLSEGGMGAVYVAEQTSTGKKRALKLMLPALVSDPHLRERFAQEARIGSRIESEHVVEVVGAGVDSATQLPWLAMELLSGETLANHVRRVGPVSVADVLPIIEQLCHAVGAAHAAGVVHRDLKPENIFLAEAKRTGDGLVVKVLDFGIAKLTASAQKTGTAPLGSPMWMAPEQTTRGGAIGPAADVWAIGLIVFYVLTGRSFWRAAEGEETGLATLLREIVLDPISGASERAREIGASLPPGFDVWFERAVARDPTARFVDAREAYGSLQIAIGVQPPAPAIMTAPAGATPALPPSPTIAEAPLAFTPLTSEKTVLADSIVIPQTPPARRPRQRSGFREAAISAAWIAALAALVAYVVLREAHHREEDARPSIVDVRSAVLSTQPPPPAPRSLASPSSPGGIVIAGGEMYGFSHYPTLTIFRIPTAGGVPTTVASSGSGASLGDRIAINLTDVVWAGEVEGHGHSVLKAPLAGGAATKLGTCQYLIGDVAVDATNAYWTCDGTGVWRTPIAGGEPVKIATARSNGIAVDSTHVYWTDMAAGTVSKSPLRGGAVEIVARDQNVPGRVTVDSANVYWLNFGGRATKYNGSVMKLSLVGGTPTTLATHQRIPAHLAVDGTHVYWTTIGDADGSMTGTASPAAVMKIAIEGGAPTVVVHEQANGLAVDAENVYWTTLGDVMSAPK